MTVRARLRAAACCAAIVGAALPAMAAAESPSASLARIYGEDDFQTAMPGAAPATTADAAEVQPQEQPAEREEAPPPRAAGPADDRLDGGIRMVGIAIGILILAVVLYVLVSAATGLRFRRNDTAERPATSRGDGADTGAQRPPDRLEDADALARQGRHAEAIHALLLTVIAALREGGGDGSGASTTAREIVRRAPLGGEPRGALAKLALTAELIHFGGRNATEERYRACLESARLVLSALPGRAA